MPSDPPLPGGPKRLHTRGQGRRAPVIWIDALTCASPPRSSTPSSATSTGNVERVLGALAAAEAAGADLCVVPELAIPGYPPEDLLLKPGFVADNVAALEKVAAATGDCAVVVGFVGAAPGGQGLANAAAVCARGRVRRRLPQALPAQLRRVRRAALLRGQRPSRRRCSTSPAPGSGVSICEDVWFDDGPVAQAGPGRGRRRGEPQRLALQPGAAARAPGHARGPGGRGRLRHRLRQPGRRPGRARLRRRLADHGGRRARCWPRAPSSPPTWSWSTSPLGRTATDAVTELAAAGRT